MFHTQKQQRGRGHNSYFSCTQEKNAYKKSERNRRVRRKESANPKPSQCTPFWDRRRERQWIPVHWKWSTPSLLLYRGCFVVALCFFFFFFFFNKSNAAQWSERESEGDRKKQRRSSMKYRRCHHLVAERTAYCAIHGKRRRRQNETRSAIVAASRHHSKSVDFSWELVLNARTLASYSSSWSVGRTSPASSRLTNVIVECEDDSRELQVPELMERLDMAGRKVLLVWKIPRPIAEGSSKVHFVFVGRRRRRRTTTTTTTTTTRWTWVDGWWSIRCTWTPRRR